MSDTPETDAAVKVSNGQWAVKASNGQWSFVLKETCQRLERERDEYRKQLTAVVPTEWAQQLERERDEARARVEIITPHENNPVAKFFSSSNTPETDAAVKDSNGQWSFVLKETCQRLERERDEANESSEAFSALAWKLEGDRNELRDKMADALQEVDLRTLDYLRMREAIIATLEENRHLTDGDDCTLAKLKSVVPEWK